MKRRCAVAVRSGAALLALLALGCAGGTGVFDVETGGGHPTEGEGAAEVAGLPEPDTASSQYLPRATTLPGADDDVASDAAFAALAADPDWAQQRWRMVEEQVRSRGIEDPEVLAALETVPRHVFVPAVRRSRSYGDEPLPIGHRQTISQPYVVALMSELLDLQPGDRVLEIGTGSGYHAAVLSRLAGRVYTIEIVEPLAARARRTLERLGYDNVEVRSGDGYGGWPEAAPFDAILLTAAPAEVPRPLLDQLAEGGRLVVPVGEGVQELTRITRTADGFETETLATVYFVPMTGEAERRTAAGDGR